MNILSCKPGERNLSNIEVISLESETLGAMQLNCLTQMTNCLSGRFRNSEKVQLRGKASQVRRNPHSSPHN